MLENTSHLYIIQKMYTKWNTKVKIVLKRTKQTIKVWFMRLIFLVFWIHLICLCEEKFLAELSLYIGDIVQLLFFRTSRTKAIESEKPQAKQLEANLKLLKRKKSHLSMSVSSSFSLPSKVYLYKWTWERQRIDLILQAIRLRGTFLNMTWSVPAPQQTLLSL